MYNHATSDGDGGSNPVQQDPSGSNPLDCLRCNSVIKCPVRLWCQHHFCRVCIADEKCCPICKRPFNGAEFCEDKVLNYVVESSREFTETCANCDQTSQPMYFCDTCHQPLCSGCRATTHKAKIFSTHNIVELEERGRVRNRPFCSQHNEPFILFCLDSKSLMCIECFNSSSLEKRGHFVNIEVAHKICCDKLEKNSLNLRIFQDELREQIELRKRLMVELDKNGKQLGEDIDQKCDQIIARVNELRQRLQDRLISEREHKQRELAAQLEELRWLESPVSINLLSVSIFCSYASKMDVLHCYADLHKSILQFLSSNGRQLIQRVKFDCNFTVDFLHEFNQSICQPLGCSLFPFADHSTAHDSLYINYDPSRSSPSTVGHSLGCQTSTSIKQMPSIDMSMNKPIDSGNGSVSLITTEDSIGDDLNSENGTSNRRNSSVVVQQSNNSNNDISITVQHLSNLDHNNFGVAEQHQMVADQRFQDQFQMIARPLAGFAQEISAVSKTLHDLQRDLTQRRCVVSGEELMQKITNCEDAWTRLEMHNKQVESVVNQHLKQIWRRELERIQRQQLAVREKAREIVQLRALAKRALKVSQQLKPFATQMASLISVIDVRRTWSVLPSPMEQLCSEITQIAPDSESRVAAIEKEEASRRAAKLEEEKSQMESMEGVKARRALREVRPPTPKLHSRTQFVEMDRERSTAELSVMTKDHHGTGGGGTHSCLSSPSMSKKRFQRRLHRNSDGAASSCYDATTPTPTSSSLISELYEGEEEQIDGKLSPLGKEEGEMIVKEEKEEEETSGKEEEKPIEEGRDGREEESTDQKNVDEGDQTNKNNQTADQISRKTDDRGDQEKDIDQDDEKKADQNDQKKADDQGDKKKGDQKKADGQDDQQKHDADQNTVQQIKAVACAQVTRGRDPELLQAREKLLESIREKVKRIE